MPHIAFIVAAVAALTIGGLHYLGHNRFGNPAHFDEAGVQRTGILITLGVFVVVFLITFAFIPV